MEKQTTCILRIICQHASVYLRLRLREFRQIFERTSVLPVQPVIKTRNRENFFTVLFTLVRTNFCRCQHWNDSFYQSRVTRLPAFTAQTVQELARLKCLHEFA